MAFSAKTANIIAYRSGYICNNPLCNVLTIGPAVADPLLSLKKGEAAHILGEKEGAPRHEAIGDALLNSAENGLWLCVGCHTLIDKNNGVDYKKETLIEWKEAHEELISVLLRTHQSPLPLVRRFSSNSKIAQDIVDTLSHRGVMFQSYSAENPTHVIESINQIKLRLSRCLRQIDLDKNLRDICDDLISECRRLLNDNSKDHLGLFSYVDVIRIRAGRTLYRLKNEYGCEITGPIASIVRQ
ncbi:HNH endonuclease [Pseudomonas moraviensis]|jgi:hypothetical protein|uniref:HNH endonuclease n=1 Tax=Pseudomonas moraviensis TaxID=321662 RepID=UPI002093FFB7|nr:HNH endonuclease [Pseudomonas moraviensis]UST71408.1 HNH endonuclease [Pseudomonas moraviensis]